MTPAYRKTLVLMREHFGIGWWEIEHVLPDWEVDTLLDALRERLKQQQQRKGR